jgi:protein-S-isoprenylcysteine O-methyltransferase Ste14
MHVEIDQLILWLWIAIFVLWGITARMTKRTSDSKSEGLSQVAVWFVWIAWWILLSRGFGVAALSRPVVPMTPTTQNIGLLATMAGLGFAIWARFQIGRNWSPLIELKEEHQLVRTGPYALVRHPIYSGFMLATLGTAIAYRAVGGFLSFLLVVVAWGYKARLEEKALRERFGEGYEAYRKTVRSLVPFIW